MKLWITIGIVLSLVIYPLASTYRQIRRERVLTTFTSQLHPGDNSIQLRLPQGTYLCVLSGSDQLSRGVGSMTAANTLAILSASGDRIEVEREPEKGVLKFHVKGDGYQAVHVNVNVASSDSGRLLFLNVGGGF